MTVDTENISRSRLDKGGEKHLKTVALRAYSGHRKRTSENDMIVEFLPMVHKIVQRVVAYLKPPLSYEDLVSAGTIGLVKAARNFDPSCRAEFKTYAYIRIKGAILDELRGWSFISANLRKKVRDALQLSQQITEQTGAPPDDVELAERLGITPEELQKTFENARAQHFVSIDGFGADAPSLGNLLASSETVGPDKQLEKTELLNKLSEAIRQLPERQRQIILLYYHQHLTMKQAAEVFGITESRVSQLHAGALFNLSVKLRQWENGRG